MKSVALAVLMLSFGLSTLSLSSEDGEACNNCDSHAGGDSCTGASGQSHGDRDDRPESSDSPCHPPQEFHCCCSHTQAISTVNVPGWLVPVEWSRIVLPTRDAHLDPSTRETFHVPLA